MATGESHHRNLVTLTTLVIALVVGGVGTALLALGSAESLWRGNVVLPATAVQLGGVLVAGVALYLLWDLHGRRTFAREVLGELEFARSATEAGLVHIGDQSLPPQKWAEFIAEAREIELFVAYASTWRKMNWTHLERAARSGVRMRVYLPDPDDRELMGLLAHRFGKSADDVRSRVLEAASDYQSLGSVDLYRHHLSPLHAIYRLGNRTVVTLYSHRGVRTSVPLLVARGGGSLGSFVDGELASVRAVSREW